jgi:DNA-binding NarL/FixJ family response regulator
MMTARARVLIVDDHPMVREGLAARLSIRPNLEVCGEAAEVDEALDLVDSLQPELIIVDLSLRSGHGLDLIKKVSVRQPATKMLVLSAHDESLFARRALRAGALGYVNKQEAQDTVIEAIDTVLRGERYLSDKLRQELMMHALDEEKRPGGIASLSDRELEIFELIGRGRSTRSIADQLHLSVHTIETHRENIRAKLHLSNGAELVRMAVQWMLEAHAS